MYNDDEEIEVTTELDYDSADYNFDLKYETDPSLRAPIVMKAYSYMYSFCNVNQLVKTIGRMKEAFAKAGANPDDVFLNTSQGFVCRMIETEEMTRKRFIKQEEDAVRTRQEQIEQARRQIEEAQKLLSELGAWCGFRR